jgi:NADH-quinone oxidoreductase subunit D
VGEHQLRNFTINFGPQHPAAHGVLRLVLELDGEVSSASTRISACSPWHREVCEHKTYCRRSRIRRGSTRCALA